ncbi:hypothetical protein KAF25_011124 [Fusarium avenaceum]|uniref:Uncharacterized protein n=1 Tax=Fusarium avenaceum TaxID=40199 RepID=A0A9P7KQC9_9HYPO|nr:hypothetical protein KAF25_011124 [Fusarium avenaceum]
MSEVIKEMMSYVWRVYRGTKLKPGGRKNPENHHHYCKWGFPIYRTYYSKESDEHWNLLLYNLRHQTKLAFGTYEDDEETNQDDRRQVRDLFHLQVHEDPSLLDGLDVRGIRDFCNAEKLKDTEVRESFGEELRVSTRPREDRCMADNLFSFVLLADEAVLKDVKRGISIVKAISLSWNGYTGYGWVRIPTGYLLDLWTYLMWNDDRLDRALSFSGSEDDLAQQVWPGHAALDYTGDCPEIRPWRHYDNQNEMH